MYVTFNRLLASLSRAQRQRSSSESLLLCLFRLLLLYQLYFSHCTVIKDANRRQGTAEHRAALELQSDTGDISDFNALFIKSRSKTHNF